MSEKKQVELTAAEQQEADSYTRHLVLLTSIARKINGPNAPRITEIIPNAIPIGPMYDAVTSGKLWRVKLALNDGADPNELSPFASSVLHVAAENGWLEIVRLLVENGADIERVDSLGRTPAAAGSEHAAVADFLTTRRA